eukprot:TRINITY_DN11135_c0_g1_i1.p1 TRINITY_DN11135_c0_g1~~TRINITY_DN11135_c0_g1_i1.p1  ORF type:complete len:205 (+),score=41.56 TRINITY_DN11135_c0_g1_i1:61-675(+)
MAKKAEDEIYSHDKSSRALTLLTASVVLQSFCIGFGCLLSFFQITTSLPWWGFWAHYLMAGLNGTLTHWCGHKHWSGRWFRAHTLEHHIAIYPPTRFLRDDEVGAEDANAKYYLPTMLFPGVFTYALTGNALDSLISVLWIAGWLWFVDKFHSAYHQRHHWLERFRFFQDLRFVHLRHHKGNMLSNFGVVDMVIDAFLGSLSLC